MIWHSSNIEDIKKELGVNPEMGLSSAEIAGKIAQYGENTRAVTEEKHIVKKVFKHLTPTLDVLLMIISAIVFVTDVIAKNDGWYVPLIALALLVLRTSLFPRRSALRASP